MFLACNNNIFLINSINFPLKEKGSLMMMMVLNMQTQEPFIIEA